MDSNQINGEFDLLSLVSKETRLQRQGDYYVGACPFCGGRDRFLIKHTSAGFRWYCRKCGDGKYHTAIDYIMRRDGLDHKNAGIKLGAHENTSRTDLSRKTFQPLRRITLPDFDWQASAWKEIDAASDQLQVAESNPGQKYLLSRGLHKGTWLAWQLGFTAAYDPAVKRWRPAILIPWFDLDAEADLVIAIKYRFIDDELGGFRYISRKGSIPILFGMGNIVQGKQTLLLVEGEINALSVSQCLPSAVTCLSFGSETGGYKDILRVLARHYRHVFLWADDPVKGLELQKSIGLICQVLRSPDYGGEKWDANRMLQERILMEYLSDVMEAQCFGKYV